METTRDVTKTDDDAFSRRIFLKLVRDEDHKTREIRTKEFFIQKSLFKSKSNVTIKVGRLRVGKT